MCDKPLRFLAGVEVLAHVAFDALHQGVGLLALLARADVDVLVVYFLVLVGGRSLAARGVVAAVAIDASGVESLFGGYFDFGLLIFAGLVHRPAIGLSDIKCCYNAISS